MNQPRRILHVISRLDGYGGARPLAYLAADQAARGERPVVAALATADDAADRLRDANVDVQVLGSRWPIDAPALVQLRRLRDEFRPNLVHAWDATALMHVIACRGRGACDPLLAAIDGEDAAPGWKRWAIGKLHSRVTAWAVGDESTCEWLAEQGVAFERIHLIRPGVASPRSPTLTRAELLEQLALPSDAQLIATAGPLERRKRIDDAIWCFELVRVLHPRVRLLVFGDGPDRARLERFANQVSEPGCVRFLGFRNDLPEWFRQVNNYWQLDAVNDAPQALLEAMAEGAPVTASDVPAHRNVIDHGESGYLTPLGDRAQVARAADELLRDAKFAQRIGAAAARRASEWYSLGALMKSYDELYQRALARTFANERR